RLPAAALGAALATSHALGQPRADLGAVLGGHDVLVLADVLGRAPGGQLVLALGLGHDVAVPELDGLQDHAHRDLQLDLGVLLGRDHLLHAEDQVAGSDPGLDQVHPQGDVVAAVQPREQVGGDGVGDLPLPVDPQDVDLTAGQRPREELLLLRGELDVTVGVEVGLQLQVLQRVEDAAAQRVLLGGRGEVWQRSRAGHSPNVTEYVACRPCPPPVVDPTCPRRWASPSTTEPPTCACSPPTPSSSSSACSTRTAPSNGSRCHDRRMACGGTWWRASGRGSATASACTDSGRRTRVTGTTPPSCCSTPTQGRSRVRWGGARRSSATSSTTSGSA